VNNRYIDWWVFEFAYQNPANMISRFKFPSFHKYFAEFHFKPSQPFSPKHTTCPQIHVSFQLLWTLCAGPFYTSNCCCKDQPLLKLAPWSILQPSITILPPLNLRTKTTRYRNTRFKRPNHYAPISSGHFLVKRQSPR